MSERTAEGVEALREALRPDPYTGVKYKLLCPRCGGLTWVGPSNHDDPKAFPCSTCKGTGLHPKVQAALTALTERVREAERERDAARLVPPMIRSTLEKALRLDMTKPPVSRGELRAAIDLLPDSPSFFSSVAGMEQLLAAERRAESAESALREAREALQAADDVLAGMWSFSEEGRAAMIAQQDPPTYWLQASMILRRALAPTDAGGGNG